MISLKNITIKVNHNILLENEEIRLYEGKLHAIVGKSGVGKTSLLYELALLTNNPSLKYYWNKEKIHLYNDYQKSNLRRCMIGYILQDLQLINEELSLIDNLKCICALSGQDFNYSKMYEYLEELQLSIDINQNINQLSRGEKQRFALLMVLMKDPLLIICDEPTSALDKNNSELLIRLLKRIAKKHYKIIVIVTHDTYILNKCDFVYRIDNKKINMEKNNDFSSLNNTINIRKIKISFYKLYNKTQNISSKRIVHLVYMILMIFICISPLLININIEKYKNIIESKSYNEIIITNTSKRMPNVTYNGVSNVFEVEEMQLIEQISNVKEINNYYEFTTYINDKLVKVIPKENINSIKVSNGLSSSLKQNEKLELNIIINKKDYNFSYILLTYEIDEYLKRNNTEEYIYIPSNEFEEILKQENIKNSASILVSCKDENSVNETSLELQRWFPNASVFIIGQNEREHLIQLNKINNFLKIINIVITICIILFSIVLQITDYKSRKKELCMLRVNGLNKYHLFILIIQENMKALIMSIVVCIVCSLIILYSSYCSLTMGMMLGVIIDIMIFVLCSKFVPWFVSIYIFIKKNNLITILRS